MVVRKMKLSAHDNEYLNELSQLNIPKEKNGLKLVSLYCGGGGLDLGFSLAGFVPAFSTDIDERFCQTIIQNLPGHVVEPHDMNDLTGEYVLSKIGDFDMVIGGPPCQSYSILGSRGSINDPRGRLVYEYAHFIRDTKPKAFLFENVPGILTVNKGADWKRLVDYFHKETSYDIRWTKLNSAMFGVPQLRERVILIGFRDKVNFNWPAQKHYFTNQPLLGLKEPRPAWMALENVEGLPNHLLRVHSERVSNRYSKILPGDRDRIDHTDRIHPDRPSGTVLVGSGKGGGRPFIHPYEDRHITVREAARLQSFPDWWVFQGGPTSQYRQVGNAVPPLMAKAIAEKIANTLI